MSHQVDNILFHTQNRTDSRQTVSLQRCNKRALPDYEDEIKLHKYPAFATLSFMPINKNLNELAAINEDGILLQKKYCDFNA
jgi:hypothetical protein